MDTRTVLQKARDYLAEHPSHWTQGALAFGSGSVCAIGAIGRVKKCKFLDAYEAPEVLELAKALPDCWISRAKARACGGGVGPVWSYNDARGRTREDVIALFDYAIRGEKMPSPEE